MVSSRVHRLAQAVQVADLVMARADELLQELERRSPVRTGNGQHDRIDDLRSNLARSVHAYRSTREP